MEATLKGQAFLKRYSELITVVGVLFVIAAVFYWIPFKIAFLSFFYLPVLAVGYLMGARRAMLTGTMCTLLVVTYFFWEWAVQARQAGQAWTSLVCVFGRHWEILLNVAMWGGFLILIGGAFGYLQEKMRASYERTCKLNEELDRQAAELRNVNQALEGSRAQLEQQAEELHEKNLQVEGLKEKVEEALYSTMDSSVARLLIQGRLREEKRDLTVLFCDLQGFTGYAHLRHPEVALSDLNDFYEVMEQLIETYHGHIDKYMGDGIMSEFGAPVDYVLHRLQAVITGLVMQKKFREQQFPWGLRVGIASGESIVGLLGSRRRSYSAIGEVVNVAKRLEEMCEASSVYVDETTVEDVRHFVEFAPVRSPRARRVEDQEIMQRIAEKERQITEGSDNIDMLFDLGKLYFSVGEASQAVNYFRRAMELRPDDDAIKVSYANAILKRDEYEKVEIRGLREKRNVFKALQLANPLLNKERFPQAYQDCYRRVAEKVEIPDDVVLPVEVVDGSVGHSLAVAVMCYALADQLGFSDELKRDLLIAGRIQDVGKSIIWHHILSRRGVLSEQERKELERHVDESVSIAKRMGYDRPGVLEIIGGHHELLNGEGYPRHARGEQISLGARIACVADVYCALTERRAYRHSWDSHVALGELTKGAAAGKFDRDVVEALGKLLA